MPDVLGLRAPPRWILESGPPASQSIMMGCMSQEEDRPYRLACMELRGGNQAGAYRAELPGLNAWISCSPMGDAGGDLYYLSACSQGVIARVVLADVAGHGELVSAAAISLRDALREHVDHWDQSALIRRLNESILRGVPHSRFATAFLGSYYRESGELLFTNAGHLPPLWYRAAENDWSLLLDSTPNSREIMDLPLGLIPGTAYSQTAVKLEPGDLLLLYTDGVSESRDSSDDQLGLDRLLEMARGLPVGSAAECGQALLSAVESFRGTVPVGDDITVLALERLSEGA
jgi:sigma-B regulation protein RsbU (phosphoserine phosphatase)